MVFNDSIFATPRPSFERPVPLVLVDPWDAPLIYLKLNVQWMPYVLGSLRQLVLQSTWDTTDPAALDLVQARAMSLINMFTLALQHPAADDCCHEIAMTDSRIKWLPSNPFTAPNDVPGGYHFPPWYIAPAHTLIPGIRMGDVVTDILHAPFNPLASGFPRLRITVKGPGTIEIKFVRFPTASIALWTIDGNLSSSQWTDLHVTLEAAIGRFDPEMVIPISVTGEGEHVIDLSIIASISEEPPFVHFGGGIRSISLCGFGAQIEPTTPTITEMEYLMSVCEQLRFHNGKLQGYCCGEWVDIAGQGTIVIGGPDQQGGGAPQPTPGECQDYPVKFDAKSQYILPTVVSEGDVLTFSNAQGAGHDGSAGPWHCPDGGSFFAGACLGVGYFTSIDDPAPTLNHMALIVLIGSTWYDASSGAVTVPSGVTNGQVLIQVNDETLGDNSGSYSLVVEVCNNTSVEWSHEIAFDLAPHGGIVHDGFGEWIAGTGWSGTDNAGITTSLRMYINLLAAAHLTRLDVTYTVTDAFNTSDIVRSYPAADISGTVIQHYNGTTADHATVSNKLDIIVGDSPATLSLYIALDAHGYPEPCAVSKLVVYGRGPEPDWL